MVQIASDPEIGAMFRLGCLHQLLAGICHTCLDIGARQHTSDYIPMARGQDDSGKNGPHGYMAGVWIE